MTKYFILIFLLAILFTFVLSVFFPRGFDQIRRAIRLEIKTGELQIGGVPPTVDQIYIDPGTGPLSCTDSPEGPGVDGIESTIAEFTITADISDVNGGCENIPFGNINAHVCNNETALPCDENSQDFSTFSMTYSSGSGVSCTYSTAIDALDLQFYYKWGAWKINVTAVDTQSGVGAGSRTQYFKYKPLVSFEYPVTNPGTISLGDVDASSWNYGKPVPPDEDYMRNNGNIRLNFTYNASDFDCTAGACLGPADKIPITTGSFCIDRDTTKDGGLAEQCMNDDQYTPEWYMPSGGLRRCGQADCSIDSDGAPNEAYFLQYWHIQIGAVETGTYQNEISVEGYSCELCEIM